MINQTHFEETHAPEVAEHLFYIYTLFTQELDRYLQLRGLPTISPFETEGNGDLINLLFTEPDEVHKFTTNIRITPIDHEFFSHLAAGEPRTLTFGITTRLPFQLGGDRTSLTHLDLTFIYSPHYNKVFITQESINR